jgi:hypothetical protein
MSEQEREQRNSDEDRFQRETDDVEAHRLNSSMTDDQNASDDEPSEDFEAHKKR